MTTKQIRRMRRGIGATELRAEQARLEAGRPRLASIVEVHGMGGRHAMSSRDGGPLQGVAVEYDGTVRGLPGIANADEAAARLREVDERLAEIDALLPEAEAAEQEAQLRAQQEDERQREQRVRAAVEAVRAEVASVEAARVAEAEARRSLNHAIAASPLGALLGARQAHLQARNAVAHALASAGGEEAQARVLAELGTDARRALPGLHTKAAPPAKAQPHEYDWLVDALLHLPKLQTAVYEAQRGGK
jgi:hypothetical protein